MSGSQLLRLFTWFYKRLFSSGNGAEKQKANNMHMTLQRAHHKADVTIGMLSIEGVEHSPIYTLENPWKDNKPWVSSIPIGDYAVTRWISPNHGDCFKIFEVDGRTDILIHIGNFETETSGCVLVGMSSGVMFNKDTGQEEPAVKSSALALGYLQDLLRNTDNLTLTVRD